MAKARRTFPPKYKAKIVAYIGEHGFAAASHAFKLHDSVVRRWQKEAQEGKAPKVLKTERVTSANGKMYYKKYPVKKATNDIAALPERDALTWLERWRQAYFDRMKAETPSAASVLAALRGGK